MQVGRNLLSTLVGRRVEHCGHMTLLGNGLHVLENVFSHSRRTVIHGTLGFVEQVGQPNAV